MEIGDRPPRGGHLIGRRSKTETQDLIVPEEPMQRTSQESQPQSRLDQQRDAVDAATELALPTDSSPDGRHGGPRRTKIVCTLGPASDDPAVLEQLIAAGMNVARLNMSHGSREHAAESFQRVRRAAAAQGAQVAILVDLQGPKIRTGPLIGGASVTLEKGQPFTITTRPIEGTFEEVSTGYEGLPEDVRPGDPILLSDGLIQLRCERVTADAVHTRVVEGGVLRERQGISLPGTEVKLPALTAKDEEDLRWAVAQGADYIAVSFVRRAEDMRAARQLVRDAGGDVPLIAKLEKPQALDHLDDILRAADGVMVARGDMGVELPPEQVPLWQKRIISAANARLRPVITATQMLESMVHEPRPTRAEATDVANAIWDGTDAVMLSAETSIGAYPIEAVRMMDRIARTAEAAPEYETRQEILRRPGNIAHAISLAGYHAVRQMPEARAIAAFTRSGGTALLVSKDRPTVPILGFCPDERIVRRLAVCYGVVPILCDEADDLASMVRIAERDGTAAGILTSGDVVALTGHLPPELPGSTNFLMLHRVS
jgi:pyruvate kinase